MRGQGSPTASGAASWGLRLAAWLQSGRPARKAAGPCGFLVSRRYAATSAVGCAVTCWPGSPWPPTSSLRSWRMPRLPACLRWPGCGPPSASLVVYAVLGSSPPALGGPGVDDGADDRDRARRPGRRTSPRGTPRSPRPSPVWSALICLVAWMARLGFLADLLSTPVLVGYMAGVAVLMIVSQLGKLTGLGGRRRHAASRDPSRSSAISATSTWPTVLLAGGVLVFLLVASAVFPELPFRWSPCCWRRRPWRSSACRRDGISVVGSMPRGSARRSGCPTSASDLTRAAASRSGHCDGRASPTTC